jgi:hypothetical protein
MDSQFLNRDYQPSRLDLVLRRRRLSARTRKVGLCGSGGLSCISNTPEFVDIYLR